MNIRVIACYISTVLQAIRRKFMRRWNQWVCEGYCITHHVKFSTVTFDGRPSLKFREGSQVTLGEDFVCKSGADSGSIGNRFRSVISVNGGGILKIGKHSGMSNTAIHCHQSITIGDYVNIGGGVQIFDTDFHSLSWKDREEGIDIKNRRTAPVVIGNLVFIGADSIILKGVHIGDKSIIGAGSVVSRNVPAGEIWAGNPARFIKKIEE